jgi:hypothetical protein
MDFALAFAFPCTIRQWGVRDAAGFVSRLRRSLIDRSFSGETEVDLMQST